MSDNSTECNFAYRHVNLSPSKNGFWICIDCDLDYCRHVRHNINHIWKRCLSLWWLHLLHYFDKTFGIDITYFFSTVLWIIFIRCNKLVDWIEFARRHSYCNSHSKPREISFNQTGASLVHSWHLVLYCHRSLDSWQFGSSSFKDLHAWQ